MLLTFDEIFDEDNLYLIKSLYITKYGNYHSYMIDYWNEDINCTSHLRADIKDQIVTTEMISEMINLSLINLDRLDDAMCLDIPLNEDMDISINCCPNITFVNKN